MALTNHGDCSITPPLHKADAASAWCISPGDERVDAQLTQTFDAAFADCIPAESCKKVHPSPREPRQLDRNDCSGSRRFLQRSMGTAYASRPGQGVDLQKGHPLLMADDGQLEGRQVQPMVSVIRRHQGIGSIDLAAFRSCTLIFPFTWLTSMPPLTST